MSSGPEFTTVESLAQAVDQLRRYSNQRKVAGEIEDSEGNERLFHANQALVTTSFDEARAGTIGADLQHFLEWKDTALVPLGGVARARRGRAGGPGEPAQARRRYARPAHLHLREPHHTPEFWRAVERAIPDWKSRRRWLAERDRGFMV